MAVTCTGEDRALTLHLSGEVDHHGAREMMAELERCVDAALPRALTLDLGGVSFMDSSGIAVLLRAWRRMNELEGSVSVTHIPAQPRRVLDAAGVGRIMTLL